ncbi:crossover junction endonuclease EME1 [Asbolus verrucosus]|uniref:Crossover junction endonuclease EME1 n=1 Tax=Asbolus verrucosus TaxID=1661398 RepID=A0A482V8G2_ASBVE|nr:crossover junction endonuclease EME1 [Asbolus verrucosus]
MKPGECINSQIPTDTQREIKNPKTFKDCPPVSKRDIEFALTELQILCNSSHRLINSPSQLGLVVAQFTKSIAELPYKLQKQEKYQQTDWFAAGDNKDCVKVDKDGNGLQRLYKQMLMTFPLASLETAEAIASKYPTITSLMEAYESCKSTQEAESMLKEIPIRRAAGPLSATRKTGPEISKKIFNFFNSVDGNTLL